MELFVVKNNAGEVVERHFSSKSGAKSVRDQLNIEAGQSEKERLTKPKFTVALGKDHDNFQA